MDKFVKSLLIGVGASIFIIGGIAAIGVWVSSEPSQAVAKAVPADNKTYSVRMRPHPVQLGGYSLKSKAKGKAKMMMVSVEMAVRGSHNQAHVCRLMPRLVSALNTAFASLASYDHSTAGALPKKLGTTLAGQFNRALGDNMVKAVSLRAYASLEDAPSTNCPEET